MNLSLHLSGVWRLLVMVSISAQSPICMYLIWYLVERVVKERVVKERVVKERVVKERVVKEHYLYNVRIQVVAE